MNNSCFEYHGINHVATVGSGGEHNTLDDFHDAVKEKYRKSENKDVSTPAAADETPEEVPESSPEPKIYEATGKFEVVLADGVGWYDVIGPEGGKPLTEKSMRKKKADRMAAEMNSGEDANSDSG